MDYKSRLFILILIDSNFKLTKIELGFAKHNH